MSKHLLLICLLTIAVSGKSFLIMNDIHLNLQNSKAYPMPGQAASVALVQTVIDQAKKE